LIDWYKYESKIWKLRTGCIYIIIIDCAQNMNCLKSCFYKTNYIIILYYKLILFILLVLKWKNIILYKIVKVSTKKIVTQINLIYYIRIPIQ